MNKQNRRNRQNKQNNMNITSTITNEGLRTGANRAIIIQQRIKDWSGSNVKAKCSASKKIKRAYNLGNFGKAEEIISRIDKLEA